MDLDTFISYIKELEQGDQSDASSSSLFSAVLYKIGTFRLVYGGTDGKQEAALSRFLDLPLSSIIAAAFENGEVRRGFAIWSRHFGGNFLRNDIAYNAKGRERANFCAQRRP
jgi:hypothetical protein